eukprot:536959_1
MFNKQFTVTPYPPNYKPSTDIPTAINSIPQTIQQPTIISTDFPTAFPTYVPIITSKSTNIPTPPGLKGTDFFSTSTTDFTTDFPTAMPTDIPIAITSDFPTATSTDFITIKPTLSPIVIRSERTPQNTQPFEFETCVSSTTIINDVSISIAKSTNYDEMMKITISGPRDKWFVVGFGAIDNKMQDSYAITVQGRYGDVFERILGA